MSKVALEQAFLSIQKKLRLSLGRILSSPQDIDDVVQETYLRAVASNTSNLIRDPEAYLFRASRNIALNGMSRLYKRLEVALPVEDFEYLSDLIEENPLEDEFAIKKQFAEFCLAVSDLPMQCRKVFVLRKVYGLSQIEIAKKLGISVSTVESHITKGMMRTRQSMSKRKKITTTMAKGNIDE
jgi:RNA polymerase sigma factor (sigma-70 family)